MARRDDARERRDEDRHQFQWETLIALQDAVARMVRAEGEIRHADQVHHRQTGEPWGTHLLPEGLSDRSLAATTEVLKLTARVADDELREMLKTLRATCTTLPRSEPEADDIAMRMLHQYEEAVERLSVLFRSV